MIPAHAAAVVVAALLLAACTDPDPQLAEGSRGRNGGPGATETSKGSEDSVESAELQVVDGELRQTIWTIEGEVYGLADEPRKLGGIVHSPLAGTYSPAAVLNPANPQSLTYSSFLRGRPVVRVHDFGSGKDSVLDEGAYSLAWNRDGALAYFKGLKPRVRDPARYPGHVIVRRSVGAEPVRWTTEARRYIVSAWAGNRLIVHQLRQGWPNLVVFDGPKRKRVLAEGAALVALSPDGARAFITKEPDPTPTVSVVDVANGREIETFTFSGEVQPIGGQPINYVADSGAWRGETVIAGVTGGLAVFGVRENEIVLEKVLGVDPDAFPLGLTELKSDETGRYVVAMAELMQKPRAPATRTALMECDLVEQLCVLGRSAPSFQPPRPVYNPSRP